MSSPRLRMHADEVEVVDEMVGQLLSTQFPQWAERELRRSGHRTQSAD